MNDKTRKRLVYASLVGAIIFALIMKPWEGRPRRTITTAPGATVKPVETATEQDEFPESAATTQLPALAWATAWPRDPFHQLENRRPGPTDDPQQTGYADIQWKLQGILTVDTQPVCILDGQTYGVGAMINSWEITYIGANIIHLRREGETISMSLPPPGVQKRDDNDD
jgi:hypothetical protein